MPRLPSTPVWIWLLTFVAVLVWSAVEPKDYFTWFLEVTPALVALPVLVATRRQFPLTPLVYVLILFHAITYVHKKFFQAATDLGCDDKLGFRDIARRIASSLVDRSSQDGLVVGIEGASRTECQCAQ